MMLNQSEYSPVLADQIQILHSRVDIDFTRIVVAHFSVPDTFLSCFARILPLSSRLRCGMLPETPQLFAGEFLLQIAAVRSPLFLRGIDNFIRASQSTGILKMMGRIPLDRISMGRVVRLQEATKSVVKVFGELLWIEGGPLLVPQRSGVS
jgi:hypothetical protein